MIRPNQDEASAAQQNESEQQQPPDGRVPAAGPALPTPIIEKQRWPYVLAWIVPLLAAVVVVVYFSTVFKQRGPEVTVHFHDASGLQPGKTMVAHLGVEVGTVKELALGESKGDVVVTIRLHRDQEAFAKTGAKFWIVKPQVSIESVSGLGTIASGPYIEALPGTGAVSQFAEGLESPPREEMKGLKLTLHAPRIEHLGDSALVYYRGIEVGRVDSVQLSGDATGVDVHITVQQNFAPLVRNNSRFWVIGTPDVKGGLFSGLQLKLDSLRALIAGGIAFASPDEMADAAKPDSDFPLYSEPKKEWDDWSPRIALPGPQSSISGSGAWGSGKGNGPSPSGGSFSNAQGMTK